LRPVEKNKKFSGNGGIGFRKWKLLFKISAEASQLTTAQRTAGMVNNTSRMAQELFICQPHIRSSPHNGARANSIAANPPAAGAHNYKEYHWWHDYMQLMALLEANFPDHTAVRTKRNLEAFVHKQS
jgi:hypothetical protein